MGKGSSDWWELQTDNDDQSCAVDSQGRGSNVHRTEVIIFRFWGGERHS